MEGLPALAVVIPLLGATGLMAAAPLMHRAARDVAGIVLATTTLGLCGWLAGADRLLVSWMGGWEPVGGKAIGIPLVVDPIGAGLAALAALLATGALVFSWRYFEALGALYHTLMLVFLGGIVGFCLTGDLFNLFVFFELLTIAAYALTAYQVEETGPLHGALNFAVTNTVAAFLMLHGIGLLYVRTGTLAMADMGRRLMETEPDAVVVVALALLSAGMFTKAAIIPFHFWLPDAHAVAPSPVSVLLSGVMIELGLYGWARLWWTVFQPVLGAQAAQLRPVIVVLGIGTALIAGLFALAQHHLKRLLAYSSISHSGLILIGIGLLDRSGLAGAGIYTLAHGAIKGSLFLVAGLILHRHGSVDELELHGRGRRQPWTGALLAVGALGLAGLPPFGTTLGKQLIEEAAARSGWGMVVAGTFVAAGAVTAGAVLRAGGRIFLGWGPKEPTDEEEHVEAGERETEEAPARTPPVLVAPVVALLVVALGVSLAPQVGSTTEAAAELFVRPERYAAAVMDGDTVTVLRRVGAVELSGKGMITGVVASLLALAVGAAPLLGADLPRRIDWLRRLLMDGFGSVRRFQSGHVGDYVTWMTVGLGGLAGVLSLLLL